MIVAGVLAPGSDIHEGQLCAQLEVSKSPLREALRQLAQDGLVTIVSNRGSRVSTILEDDVREVYGLRRYIEPYGARLAAERITPTELDELTANIEAMAGSVVANDAHAFAQLDVEFHLVLARTAGHRRLLRIQESLQAEMLRLVIHRLVHSSGLRVEAVAEHRAIVEALRAHDGDQAERRMYRHIMNAEAWQRQLVDHPENGNRAHALGLPAKSRARAAQSAPRR
jgi:DNA-binding GntR family transcriptional regulator